MIVCTWTFDVNEGLPHGGGGGHCFGFVGEVSCMKNFEGRMSIESYGVRRVRARFLHMCHILQGFTVKTHTEQETKFHPIDLQENSRKECIYNTYILKGVSHVRLSERKRTYKNIPINPIVPLLSRHRDEFFDPFITFEPPLPPHFRMQLNVPQAFAVPIPPNEIILEISLPQRAIPDRHLSPTCSSRGVYVCLQASTSSVVDAAAGAADWGETERTLSRATCARSAMVNTVVFVSFFVIVVHILVITVGQIMGRSLSVLLSILLVRLRLIVDLHIVMLRVVLIHILSVNLGMYVILKMLLLLLHGLNLWGRGYNASCEGLRRLWRRCRHGVYLRMSVCDQTFFVVNQLECVQMR